ncbi:hypothetical protein POF51_25925 [Brevibacillus sp. AG]|uniref:hypothetical protein n=1 Tax=Brevibacillus sp. AG TaxID=3020891 RepID=UPI00232CA0FA|nr:hypothetical protein [Brevibacillus sp. AG]MDC0764162.1 hypothetical protein [Brevibacillus sp. AG]
MKTYTIKEAAKLLGVSGEYISRRLDLMKPNDSNHSHSIDETVLENLRQERDSEYEGISCEVAAGILGVTHKTLWLKAKSGEVPSYTIVRRGRNVLRFNPEVITELKEKLVETGPEILVSGDVFLFQPWISSDPSDTGRVIKIKAITKFKTIPFIQTSNGRIEPVDKLKEEGWLPQVDWIEPKKRKYMNGIVTLKYTNPKDINDELYNHFIYIFQVFGLSNIQLNFTEDQIIIETKRYKSEGKWEDFHFHLLSEAVKNGGGSISWSSDSFTIEPDLEGYLANLSGEKRKIVNQVLQIDNTTKQDLVESGIELYIKNNHPHLYQQLKLKGMLINKKPKK